MGEPQSAEVQVALRALRDLAATLQRHTEATSKYLGMSWTEVRTLNFVSRRGAVTPTELSVYLGVTSGGVTGIIDRLESSGHLRRTDDRHDRRKIRIEVTDSAREVARRSLGSLTESLGDLLSSKSAEELELLSTLLGEVEARIEAHATSLDTRPPARPPSRQASASAATSA
ncbi:MAG: MarR family winged helix-turn-helix transcriptional regulator [Candidatus Dormibacteria bacterium]